MKLYFRLLAFVITIVASTNLYSQEITITPGNQSQTYEGEDNKAKVDIISNSPSLVIDENNGETIQAPQKRSDGKYVYSCICDVRDTNKFGFIIAVQGGINKERIPVYIEEGQLKEFNVSIEEIPAVIQEIKELDSNKVIPEENTARATVTSSYNRLKVASTTGEPVDGPTLNDVGTFDYIVTFNLATPESREKEYQLEISIGNDKPHIQPLLGMTPKKGYDIAVVVLQESCYLSKTRQAQNNFLQGNYRDAYTIYKQLVDTDECSDKPADISGVEKKMNEADKLAGALMTAQHHYQQADKYNQTEQHDSCRYHHERANQIRNLILKLNPADQYCLEYNRKYEKYRDTAPRMVSGKVVNNARLDMNGNNLPLDNALIVMHSHKRDRKKVNGVYVPIAGDRINGSEVLIGRSNSEGNYSVSVPRNTPGIVYVLYFTTEEGFNHKTYGAKYIPEDKDFIKMDVKISPKNLNSYNK